MSAEVEPAVGGFGPLGPGKVLTTFTVGGEAAASRETTRVDN
jgi:hypothetical protein